MIEKAKRNILEEITMRALKGAAITFRDSLGYCTVLGFHIVERKTQANQSLLLRNCSDDRSQFPRI